MSGIEQHLLMDMKILDEFKMTLKHNNEYGDKECGEVCGLVKGGLTGQPRLFCFKCDRQLDDSEITIQLSET